MAIPFEDQAALEAYCLPFIRGEKLPETAAELMASRYVAYALQKVDYIVETHDPDTRTDADREATEQWASRAKFQSLKILRTEDGEKDDERGEVEFEARFTIDGEEHVHHERSQFVKKDGQWFFEDGRQVYAPVRREGPKIGRNDPCSCGSGKKYKKCHGKNA